MKITFKESKEFRDFLKNKIRSFNNDHSTYHKDSRKEGYTKFVEIKEEDNSEFIAGVTARIFWQMMFIDTLFVEESHRKTGFGKKMLNKIVEIAQNNDCKYIALETYSFQAKRFYEKNGFEVVGALVDYPPGETFYTMRRNLNE